ncbi:superoxide dismutase [Cu-Zn] SodC1 [Shimwellia pseudoproteus]|uniref:superoxide dismutase family protein n=1 Tax=Shimwellia pseudoproteus TaxID=570012 RepID=UPI0018ED7B05|nr:superoxide dismutase family protein [Shimwellia pseudoproteus]MBJ3816771.1 superoxide dismutase [Cu-Zn] SodC1 [Shimwellia pseudoproteus]
MTSRLCTSLPGILAGVLISHAALAATLTVPIHEALTTGQGKSLGEITITETQYGLLFTPHISGLKPGIHGFHIHTNPSCDPGEDQGKVVPALKAGGHLDPQHTGKHLGPYNDKGHLGDLPGLVVTDDGNSSYPLLAPRLKTLSDVKGHSLMIHAQGDNYADSPRTLGGSGIRYACGVIQ